MGVGGQRHATAALPSGKTGTHCIGGWVGPRAGLDGCGNLQKVPVYKIVWFTICVKRL